jgi:hypothetical protein
MSIDRVGLTGTDRLISLLYSLFLLQNSQCPPFPPTEPTGTGPSSPTLTLCKKEGTSRACRANGCRDTILIVLCRARRLGYEGTAARARYAT